MFSVSKEIKTSVLFILSIHGFIGSILLEEIFFFSGDGWSPKIELALFAIMASAILIYLYFVILDRYFDFRWQIKSHRKYKVFFNSIMIGFGIAFVTLTYTCFLLLGFSYLDIDMLKQIGKMLGFLFLAFLMISGLFYSMSQSNKCVEKEEYFW